DKIVPIAKKPTISVEINDLTTVETLHATSLQPLVNAESPNNTEGLRVKPAMTAQSKGSSKEHSKGINPLVREIQFVATGTSEAGIEFYSWDFNYNPEPTMGQAPLFKPSVMLDKEGRQTAKFKAGLHTVAVKVVDNDGLESIEVIKLKVNGTVEKL
ncbi:MAG: hypothetical protein LBT29_01540, partial [Flavobacteriaceae bacterium]|nr:hypothetical protein [Flavobacteriaceae bacterium]